MSHPGGPPGQKQHYSDSHTTSGAMWLGFRSRFHPHRTVGSHIASLCQFPWLQMENTNSIYPHEGILKMKQNVTGQDVE